MILSAGYCLLLTALLVHSRPTSIEDTIRVAASKDNINLDILDITPTALAAIVDTYKEVDFDFDTIGLEKPYGRRGLGNLFDIHAHAEPDWYQSIAESLNASPRWNISAHSAFMNAVGITHTVLGFTGPSANVYMGDRLRTAALARLINEQLAAYARTQSDKFSFFAAVPLPWADDAVRELEYATKELGAVGVALMSNHEGKYLGNSDFQPFWDHMNGMGGRQIVYVHPTTPYVKVNGTFVVANPYPQLDTARLEYYAETARTFIDLTLSHTLQNYTNTHFVLPHAGGAFPALIDRVVKVVGPDIYDASLEIYRTRFWWDSASPTYFHQVTGLLGYEIPSCNLLFGTDFPFVNAPTNLKYLQSIMDYPHLSQKEKDNLLSNNYKTLFQDKLNF